MQVVRFVALVALAVSTFASQVFAQVTAPPQAMTKLIDCPDNQIPDAYKADKRWKKGHVGTLPVVPEFFSTNEFEAISRVKEYLQMPTDTTDPKVRAGHIRLMTVISYEVFTPPGTLITEAPPVPPQEFRDALAASQLHYRYVPCGKTRLKDLSWAAPDAVVEGITIPQAGIEPGPWVVDWAEEGVVVPDGPDAGLLGVRVIESDPIELKTGPNVGSTVTVRIILRCGNPDTWLGELAETVHVTEPLPVEAPKPAAPITEAIQQLQPPPPAPAEQAEEAPVKTGGLWIPCVSGKHKWLACLGAAASIAVWQWPHEKGLPASAANRTPVKNP